MQAWSADAAAQVITFDDLVPSANGLFVTNGYANLNWSNFGYVTPTQSASLINSGYAAGTISGANVGFNAYSNPASFSSDTAFNFISTYVTRAWSNGTTHFAGYNGDAPTLLCRHQLHHHHTDFCYFQLERYHQGGDFQQLTLRAGQYQHRRRARAGNLCPDGHRSAVWLYGPSPQASCCLSQLARDC